MAAGDWINKAKEFADDHKGQVQGALDKAEDVVKSKTGGKYDDKIAKGRGVLRDKLGIPDHEGGAEATGGAEGETPGGTSEGTHEPGQG